MRTEFPNLAIVAVVLRDFCAPWLSQLEACYPTPEDKLSAVRSTAIELENTEVLAMCDYIERAGLTRTFFPEVE